MLPLPTELVQTVHHYTSSQADVHIESDREIKEIEDSNINAVDFIDAQIAEEEWISWLALECKMFLNPDIVAVSWNKAVPLIITDSDLYWGTY